MTELDKDLATNQETTKLANKIRDLLGEHMLKLSQDNNYKVLLTSCIIALAVEVGRLRWLSTSTGEIHQERFDQIFWEAVARHYDSNKLRFGV